MKAIVAAVNQEKALLEAFSVIVKNVEMSDVPMSESRSRDSSSSWSYCCFVSSVHSDPLSHVPFPPGASSPGRAGGGAQEGDTCLHT